MMTRVQRFNRWIIIRLITVFHVTFVVQSEAHAESLSPSPHELQSGQHPSKTTVFAVVATVFFFVGLLSVYIRHCLCFDPRFGISQRNTRRRAYDVSSRRRGLENDVIESFPVFAYSSVKEAKIGSGNLECAICLYELEDRETVRLLPICNHLFHIDCIDAWLYSHVTCPVCRSNLIAKSDKTGEEGNIETRDPMINHVVIDIDGYLTGDNVETTESHHRQTSFELVSKFPRSNSTGHLMVRLNDGAEKLTLRLPEDVQMRIMAPKGRRLKRTRSFDAYLTAEGRVAYCRSGEENSHTFGWGGKSDRVKWAYR